jgi:sporulation protein YlmC with PRC-barrel domain
MAKDGYWRSSEGNGFGYPIRAYGFGTYGDNLDRPAYGEPGYLNARPGYEVRVLNEAANILARRRQQQPCEGVLATMRAVYKHFLTEMKAGGAPMAATPDWRQRQIRAAVPVTGPSVALRSDELLGVEVRNPNNLALGSVDDLILSPRTGDIIYDVIASGGIFGFDESYVPVPWDDFKATPGASLLVLDTTKSGLDGAPHVKEDAFSVGGAADAEMQKVNAYWKARQPAKASN